LSTILTRTQQIALSLEDKAYADAFCEAEIATTLPFQIRAMRKERGWRQEDLARITQQKQKTISDFENPNYARFSLNSLRRLASAFDVALIVRFAPFSELVDWASTLSSEKLNAPPRGKDARLKRQRDGVKGETPNSTSTSTRISERDLFESIQTNDGWNLQQQPEGTGRRLHVVQRPEPPVKIKTSEAA
jgi:transcriptional regulator with XRE-family HTH domain